MAERELAGTSRDPREDDQNTVPRRTSVLVMPLRDLSPNQTKATFCEGVADELAATLGRLPGVQVSAGVVTSSNRLGHSAKSVAASLGYGHVLDGSIRPSGDRYLYTWRYRASPMVVSAGLSSSTSTPRPRWQSSKKLRKAPPKRCPLPSYKPPSVHREARRSSRPTGCFRRATTR